MIELLNTAQAIITTILIPLAFALCILYFFWGMVKYLRAGAGSEKVAEDGRRIMIWGVVGLFVAFSVWGIVNLIRDELGLPDVQNVDKEASPQMNFYQI